MSSMRSFTPPPCLLTVLPSLRCLSGLRAPGVRSALIAGGLALLAASRAQAQIVISQIYGGGNNSGALYDADFIELYNTTGAAINLSTAPGWCVAYAAATGTSW